MADRAAEVETLEPRFVTVAEAAKYLAISMWSTYQLCNDGSIETRYKGRRRLVVVKSLQEYADRLPTEPPASDAS